MIFEGAALLPPDAAIGDPLLRRDDALLNQKRLGLCADAMQIFDGEMVREDDVFARAVEPVRALALGAMPQRAETRLGEDRMTRAKRDELARRQTAVARERFEDVADVGVGNPDALFGYAAREMRTALLLYCGLHTRCNSRSNRRVNVPHADESSDMFRSVSR